MHYYSVTWSESVLIGTARHTGRAVHFVMFTSCLAPFTGSEGGPLKLLIRTRACGWIGHYRFMVIIHGAGVLHSASILGGCLLLAAVHDNGQHNGQHSDNRAYDANDGAAGDAWLI